MGSSDLRPSSFNRRVAFCFGNSALTCVTPSRLSVPQVCSRKWAHGLLASRSRARNGHRRSPRGSHPFATHIRSWRSASAMAAARVRNVWMERLVSSNHVRFSSKSPASRSVNRNDMCRPCFWRLHKCRVTTLLLRCHSRIAWASCDSRRPTRMPPAPRS